MESSQGGDESAPPDDFTGGNGQSNQHRDGREESISAPDGSVEENCRNICVVTLLDGLLSHKPLRDFRQSSTNLPLHLPT